MRATRALLRSSSSSSREQRHLPNNRLPLVGAFSLDHWEMLAAADYELGQQSQETRLHGIGEMTEEEPRKATQQQQQMSSAADSVLASDTPPASTSPISSYQPAAGHLQAIELLSRFTSQQLGIKSIHGESSPSPLVMGHTSRICAGLVD